MAVWQRLEPHWLHRQRFDVVANMSHRLQKLDPKQLAMQPFDAADFSVALARAARCAPSTAALLESRLRLLRAEGPRVAGGCFAADETEGCGTRAAVPAKLRADVTARLHVLCRMRGATPHITTPADLADYLNGSCDGLLDALQREWYPQDCAREDPPEC